jgi:DNA adenine methylase
VIYADPPYLKKVAKYKHDFAEPDHKRLADVLRRFKKTRVVVSYYDHPRLAELYPGWRLRHIVATKSLVNSGMRDETGATKAAEVLLINQPAAAQASLF